MNRWLGIRIDFISNIVVFGTALLVSVLLPVNAGLAGLAITAAINLTDNLSWFVRMVSATGLSHVDPDCVRLSHEVWSGCHVLRACSSLLGRKRLAWH